MPDQEVAGTGVTQAETGPAALSAANADAPLLSAEVTATAPDAIADSDHTIGDAVAPGQPPAPADRPGEPAAPGSLADLRQRLERLPLGHPSSPYHVDGEPKPPPPRLKHLELAPPGPERAAPEPAKLSWAASADPDDEPASPPVLVSLADEEAAVGDRNQASAAADEQPAPSAAIAANGGPERDAPVMRAARLTSDQARIADEAYDRFVEAAGRTLFGGFNSTGLTARLREVAGRLEHGRLAPGSDEHALLDPDAFKARFAEMLRRHPERTPDQLARRVPGALSYSLVFDAEHYSEGIWIVQEALDDEGYRLQARKNGWNGSANRCVYTMWRDPASNLLFEVQFHTTASLEAQHLARNSANLINDPRLPDDQVEHLRSDVASVWAALPAPPGNTEIDDYRRNGRPAQPTDRERNGLMASSDPRHQPG